MQAIEDGMYQPSMKTRMDELERQKADIEARLNEAPADIPDVHPNVAEIYRRKVRELTETLAHPETRDEAAEAIRSLVGQVVLTPGEGRGVVKARLSGELMAILDFAAGRRPAPRPEVITTAVAGPRFEAASADSHYGVKARSQRCSTHFHPPWLANDIKRLN
ncbi:hypothetical protein FFK22_035115 [Mycobacterium sp. KBS0706]|nr:hypothetical protein FFK22_035115 [Mycobacterium sp. KBS0706]